MVPTMTTIRGIDRKYTRIQDLFTCDTSTKWIVSHINKPYVYVGNRVGLDYFLNIPSSRLD